MLQTITIEWRPIRRNEMPRKPGTYLVVFDDGAVESYPMSDRDLHQAEVRDGHTHGLFWADPIPTPL